MYYYITYITILHNIYCTQYIFVITNYIYIICILYIFLSLLCIHIQYIVIHRFNSNQHLYSITYRYITYIYLSIHI